MTRRTLIAVLVAQLLAVAAIAQDAELRASSGPIRAVAKQPQQFSGSLGFSLSRSAGRGGTPRGYDATFGGAVLEDRLWFFGSTQHQEAWGFGSASAFDAKLTAQPDRSGHVFFSGNIWRRTASPLAAISQQR